MVQARQLGPRRANQRQTRPPSPLRTKHCTLIDVEEAATIAAEYQRRGFGQRLDKSQSAFESAKGSHLCLLHPTQFL
ncbi:unnamed protein product [Parajaminaea phylloscopi]